MANWAALDSWFGTSLGRAVMTAERALCDRVLGGMFGYHLVQLGVHAGEPLFRESRINHCVLMTPWSPGSPHCQALTDFEALPFAQDSIDVMLLHHVLEFAGRPHQVLREATRVLAPQGYLVLVGFNPWSLMGARLLGTRACPGAVLKGRLLRLSRMRDWLELMDLEVCQVVRGFYRLPVNGALVERGQRFAQLAEQGNWPGAGVHVVVARKRVVALTPHRLKWRAPSPIAAFGAAPTAGRQTPAPLPEQAFNRQKTRFGQ